MLRRLLFAGCVDDLGLVAVAVDLLLRVLLGVVVARLTGVRRRFGEVDFAIAALADVRFGDFLPVENGAVDAADTGGVADVVLLVFVAADPNCCCCRRVSLHNLARARASAAASFFDFLAGVAPPLSPPPSASAFRFLGGIVEEADIIYIHFALARLMDSQSSKSINIDK